MLQILRPLPMPGAALYAGSALAPITITSSATFSAAENQTAVATLTASGGTGSYTWSKIGGADTAKFTLTGAVLTFATAPDFETPTDANTDNVYLVQVQASDGVGTPATQNISVTVTNVAEALPATWNSADRGGALPTLSNGNLTATGSSGLRGYVRSTAGPATGTKFYFEITWGGSYFADNDTGCGILTSAQALTGWWGFGAGGVFVATGNGNTYYNNNGTSLFSLGAVATGQTICFAVDLVNKRFWARKNSGNWNNSGTANPATNVGGIDISSVFASANAYFGMSVDNTGVAATVNAGATAFTYSAPSGFGSLNSVL